ncbi:MAG: BatD family protein, partial [Acidobacteria bacterium]|nr:BatD family protein [Acidobacteriota bacterium]
MAATAARPLAASPYSVNVSLTPAVIGRDETATLTIEIEGGGLGGFRFEPSYLLENLAAAGGPSRFEDFSFINGSLSHTFRYSLQLRPLAAGPARVRSLVIQVHGQQVRLPDQEIRVQEQPAGPSPGSGGTGGAPGQPNEPEDLFDQLFGRGSPFAPAPRSQSPAAFLRAELQPPRPLAGEQAVYTVYLYSREDVAAISPTATPNFQGFWVRDLPPPERSRPEMMVIAGDRYGRVPMIRKALFALRPGHHVLEPAGCDVVVEPPGRGFFGPAIPRSEELHLRAPELAVDVQPLPPAPAGFGGLVGQVSLAARLQPYSVRLGDGVTLTVTLAGTGHLQGVAAPRLDLPAGLTVFPPQQQSEDHVDGTTVEGRRTWTYVLVPSRPGQYSVRPQPISYFDPQ